MLHDALAGDGELGLEDGPGLGEAHGVALDGHRVVDVLEVRLLLRALQRGAVLADRQEVALQLIVDAT